MIDLMQNVLLIFIEAMCCKSFFETFGAIRYKGWINFIQILLLLSRDRFKFCVNAKN